MPEGSWVSLESLAQILHLVMINEMEEEGVVLLGASFIDRCICPLMPRHDAEELCRRLFRLDPDVYSRFETGRIR